MGLVGVQPAEGAGGKLHLLVGLHLPAHDAKGIGRGVVVDLDAAEGLGTRASREPSLVAIIIKHHSGPAGTDDRLAAGGRKRERGQSPFYMGLSWEIPRDKDRVWKEESDTEGGRSHVDRKRRGRQIRRENQIRRDRQTHKRDARDRQADTGREKLEVEETDAERGGKGRVGLTKRRETD